MLHNEIFHQDYFVASHIYRKTEVCIGLGFLVTGYENKTGQVFGDLDPGEFYSAVWVAKLDQEIETEARDFGKGTSRIDGLGGKDRIYLILEISFQKNLMFIRKVLIAGDMYICIMESRAHLFFPVILSQCKLRYKFFPYEGKLFCRGEHVR